MGKEEQQIIQDFLEGKNPGYGRIMSWIESIACHRGWDHKIDVKSVIGDARMALLQNFREMKYRGGGLERLKRYVKYVSRNIAFKALEKWFIRQKYEEPLADGSDVPSRVVTPEEEAIRREELEVMREAFYRLDGACRRLLLLKEACGWSYERIGAMLGISTGTAKVRLFRCRKRLREIRKELENR